MQDRIKNISDWLGTGAINIFGRPFAGKDTQCRRLAELLNGELIGGGDILRSYDDQARIKKYMSAGELIPSDLFFEIVLPFLSRDEIKNKPLILSSVGRERGEETVVLKATEDSAHPIKAVVLLQLTEEMVWQRIEEAKVTQDRGRRSDDDRAVLKTRLKKFNEETMPVIEFYRAKDLVIDIDGTMTRDQVTDSILKELAERAEK